MSLIDKEPAFRTIDSLPDLGPPEAIPEGFEPIKLLPGQQRIAPKIRWGNLFDPEHPDCKPLEWQLDRAQKVASAMNHAADVAQQELRKMIDIANKQKELLDQAKRDFESQRTTMKVMTERHNEQQQARIHEMQDLKAERARLIDTVYLLVADTPERASFVSDVMEGRWNATMEERKKIARAKQEVRNADQG